MQEELDRIVRLGTLPDGSTVTWAKPSLPDASGIVVGLQPPSSTASAERGSADAGETLAVDDDAAVAAIGSAYDVVVEEGALPEVTGGPRRSSTAPFIGGARMRNKASGTICTTGIPLMRTDRSDNLLGPAFLTADHCGSAGDEWVTTASTAPTLGRMRSFFSGGADLKFLEDARGVSDFTTRRLGRLYSGPGNTYTTIPIYGRTVPLLGTTVCMGGASSGTVCDAKINWVGVTYAAFGGAGGVVYRDGIQTASPASKPPAGDGDSGGPVYYPHTSTSSLGNGAIVVGIVSARNPLYDVPCLGDPTSPSRGCSTSNWFAPMEAISRRTDGSKYMFLYYNENFAQRILSRTPTLLAEEL